MAYTKLTDFAAKDSLLTGNPLKIIKGVDIDAEFESLEAMLSGTTGSGDVVLQTSPTLVTPVLGVATATSVNGLVLNSGAAGTSNIAIGSSAMDSSLAGSNDSIAIGENALTAMTTGDYNVAIGKNALSALVASQFNTAVGVSAASVGTTLTYTTAIGWSALNNSTGNANTALGHYAGNGVAISGDNNTLIGFFSAPSAAGVSNEITLGNSSIATLRCQVTSITALSDRRDKTDIAPLDSGLETVMSLNPVRFTWNMRDGGKIGVKDSGFIAQDLQTVDDDWLRLVYAENPEKLEASYGRLIPVLVKAIQELKLELDALKAKQ